MVRLCTVFSESDILVQNGRTYGGEKKILYLPRVPSERKNALGLPSCAIVRAMVLLTLITENSRAGPRTTLSETEHRRT
jgi:hypothetical protein